METKFCGKCDRTLPVVAFSKHRGRPDGLQAYCKECSRAANKVKYDANAARETVEIPAEKRCAGCRIVLPAAMFYRDRRRPDGLYGNCKTCHLKLTGKWAAANTEQVRRNMQAAYARNPEPYRRKSRVFYHANRAVYLARNRQWKLENRARATALESVRRGRVAGAAGGATPEQIAARVAYFGGRCWMCRSPWEQIDHVKPIAKGGSNWPANLRPACKPCNNSKSDRWPLAA